MKLLGLTDLHLCLANPIGRKDDYFHAILTKVRSLLSYAMTVGVDAVLCAGDVTNAPNVAPDVGTELATIIHTSRIPWKVILGQHDMLSENLASLSSTMTGLLAEALGEDLFEILPNAWEGSIGTVGNLYIAGFHHRYHGEYQLAEAMTRLQGKVHLVMAHQMVVEAPKPEGFVHCVVGSLPLICPLTLCGDYHPGVWRSEGGATIVNPGALARTKRIASDMQRAPAALLIDTEKSGPYGYELLRLEVPYARDVWRDDAAVLAAAGAELQQFAQELGKLDAETVRQLSPEQMVEMVATRGKWEQPVLQIALQALREAKGAED